MTAAVGGSSGVFCHTCFTSGGTHQCHLATHHDLLITSFTAKPHEPRVMRHCQYQTTFT